jgi:hypothetical protein
MLLRLPRNFGRFVSFRLAGYRCSITLYATQGESRTYECDEAGCRWTLTDTLYPSDAVAAAAFHVDIKYHAADHESGRTTDGDEDLLQRPRPDVPRR